jgi:hypothetical protein
MRVRHETRSRDDGYRCPLVPGLRSSEDARRLADEIAFASGRLLLMAADPPGLYRTARELAASDIETATWMCFLLAYISPGQGGGEDGSDGDEGHAGAGVGEGTAIGGDEGTVVDPFAGIRRVLQALPSWERVETAGEVPELASVPLGARSAHDRARGTGTLAAYAQWVRRWGSPASGPASPGGGAPDDASDDAASQRAAFVGDPTWSAERRFDRLFERLALPGLGRAARFELLLVLGRLGLYELRGDSLHLAAGRGSASEDLTTAAAKRVFGIGDPLLLERRAAALAEAAGVPLEALDLTLANWGARRRATVGFPATAVDEAAGELAAEALEI